MLWKHKSIAGYQANIQDFITEAVEEAQAALRHTAATHLWLIAFLMLKANSNNTYERFRKIYECPAGVTAFQ